MKNIQNIYISALVVTMVIIGISMFYTSILSFSGKEQANIGLFNETSEVLSQTELIKNETDDIVARTAQDDDRASSIIGGVFQVMKLPLKAANVFNSLITSLNNELKLPGIANVSSILILIIGIVVLIEIIKFWRGIA